MSAQPVVSLFLFFWFVDEALTCRQGEGHQVCEKIAGEVSLALVKRGRDLTTDLLCQLRTHHGWNTLGCLLGHLQRGEGNMLYSYEEYMRQRLRIAQEFV